MGQIKVMQFENECSENDGISDAVDDELNQTDKVVNMNAPVGMSKQRVFPRLLIMDRKT
jgi:hypothetical protein